MRTKLLLSTAAIALTMGAGAFAQSPRSEQPTDRPAQARQSANAQSQRAQTERIPDSNRQGAQQSSEPRRIGHGQAQGGETTRAPSTAQRQPAPSSNARTADPNSQPSGVTNRAAQGQPAQPAQRQTTAQGAQDTRSAPQRAQRPAAQAPSTAQSQPADTARSSTSRSQTAQASSMRQGSAGTVALNTEQQTRISQTLTRHNVRPLTNVDFSVSVGTTIPRSVRLRALTPDLVTFVPQYRGYSYFVVEEQVVIVEPRTHRIVALVPYAGGSERVSGGKAMVGAPMTTRSVSLGTGEREVVRRHVRRQTTTTVPVRKRYVIGETVPSTVVMESFPEVVYTEAPTLRPYRYFVEDDDVILVDPSEHRVVEIIR